MSSWITDAQYIRCPFYITHSDTREKYIPTITCGHLPGLELTAETQLRFRGKVQRSKYIDAYCKDRFTSCPLFRVIAEEQEREEYKDRAEKEKKREKQRAYRDTKRRKQGASVREKVSSVTEDPARKDGGNEKRNDQGAGGGSEERACADLHPSHKVPGKRMHRKGKRMAGKSRKDGGMSEKSEDR